ncbi:DUF4418 family protein [Oxalobacter sp. OttesenSCG-928-P03]|nr:DUF4418 family protein [Oxalobacter sp. OttesenSCG-928-P03]
MANRIITSLSIIVLGLLTAILPYTLLQPCSGMLETVSGVHIPMKCFWTARMALGTGIFFCISGVLLYLSKSVLVRLGISLMLFLNAVLLAAIPLFLIGVCTAQTMPCRMGTLPGLVVPAVLTGLVSLGNMVYLNRLSKRKGGQ